MFLQCSFPSLWGFLLPLKAVPLRRLFSCPVLLQHLSLDAELDLLDSQMSLLLQQIHERAKQCALYEALATNPQQVGDNK